MNKMRALGVLAATVAVFGVVGVAVAFVQSDQPSTVEPAKATVLLGEGPVTSGKTYTISSIGTDSPDGLFCYEIATEVGHGHGCVQVPSAGSSDPSRPRTTTLGTDRFVSQLAAPGVDGLRVRDRRDDTVVAESRTIAIDGVGRLLVATWSDEVVTSENPEPERTVEYLGSDGRVVATKELPG